MIHALKIFPEYFEEVVSGRKTFDIRENDRFYEVGDLLALNEHNGDYYTGRSCVVEVTYILENTAFCKEGYVVMSIKPCAVTTSAERFFNIARDPYIVPLVPEAIKVKK